MRHITLTRQSRCVLSARCGRAVNDGAGPRPGVLPRYTEIDRDRIRHSRRPPCLRLHDFQKAIIRKIYDNRAERFGFVDSVAGRRFDGIPSIMSLSSASGMAQHGSRPVRKRVQGRASLSAGEVLMALGTGFSVFGTSSATSNAEVCEHRSSRLSRNLRLTLVRSSSSWGDLRGQTPCPIP